MDDFVIWLRVQLDDDERVAKIAADRYPHWATTDEGDVVQVGTGGSGYLANGPWGTSLFEVGEHIARHDPARVLAEVDAKRRILDIHHDDGHGDCDGCGLDAIGLHVHQLDECPTLLALALAYADRPGYRDEWRS
ncbi:DUF6221 family protein [Micromonospora sp. NPDC005174]|uniref:DUF6221 family protein n=1 Tax=Micromonospora sp. NPDC005174 TaxID=3157018 RepID=UPI0033B1B027